MPRKKTPRAGTRPGPAPPRALDRRPGRSLLELAEWLELQGYTSDAWTCREAARQLAIVAAFQQLKPLSL